MRAFALTALLLTSFASRARADTLADFEAARVAYEDQRYDEAATRLERIVLEPATSAVASAIVLESRKYLAASYLFLGRQPEAQDQFVLLLRQMVRGSYKGLLGPETGVQANELAGVASGSGPIGIAGAGGD